MNYYTLILGLGLLITAVIWDGPNNNGSSFSFLYLALPGMWFICFSVIKEIN